MITIRFEPHWAGWRDQARALLQRGVRPEDVDWVDATQSGSLLQEVPAAAPSRSVLPADAPPLTVPAEFLRLGANVAAHTDPRRWGVLYRLLHRLTLGGQRHLLAQPADPDTRQCQLWAKAVGRDIHKMHAFVRFRRVGADAATGREQFVAWFEPAYRIVQLAAPFFEKRFAGMDWSILTPEEGVCWDGRQLRFLPGCSRADVPAADAHDDLWRAYYRSIFNPARVKVRTMQSEMPRKYWHNLPEAPVIAGLIAGGTARVQGMLETPERPVKPTPDNAYLQALHARRRP